MLIYFLRHGETEYNAERRYQGTRDIPLSAAGRAALRPPGLAPAVVYTSTLCRTIQTAEILFPGARIQPVADLREMCFGDFEGRSYIEMGDDPDYRAWVEGWCLGRCPGSMEDRAQFIDRVCRAFAALVDEALAAGEESLVIIAHGGTQMAALSQFADQPRDYYDWKVGNAAGFVLDAARWPAERRLTLVGELHCTKDE